MAQAAGASSWLWKGHPEPFGPSSRYGVPDCASATAPLGSAHSPACGAGGPAVSMQVGMGCGESSVHPGRPSPSPQPPKQPISPW